MRRGNRDVGGMGQGVTARTSTAPDAQEIRAAHARDARGPLAAILFRAAGINPATANPRDPAVRSAVADIAELADILGITERPRRPGYCACGRPLTLTATSHRPGDYDRGRCLACSRAARQGADGTDRPPTSTQERP